MITGRRKIISYSAYLLTIILISVISVSCMGGMGPFAGTAGEEINDNGIETFEVRRGDIFQIVSTTGSIYSNIQNNYSMQGSGEIISAMEKGDSFKKGDILVELDKSEGMESISQMEKDIELSEISLDAAKLNYQSALDSNHIAVQLAGINTEQAEKSTEAALDSLEDANSNAKLSYENSVNSLENTEDSAYWSMLSAKSSLEEAERILAADPTDEVKQYNVKAAEEKYELTKVQQESSIESSENSLGSNRLQNESSVKSAENSYQQSILNQSSTYWNNLGSSQNAEAQIVSTRQNINKAEIQLELAKMNLESVEKDLIGNYTIYAPYDGIVMSSDFRTGNYNSGNMISIISNDFIIKATIGETDFPKVSTGNEAYITLDAYPDSQFSGKVEKVIPISTDDSGIINFEIMINFNDNNEFEIFYGFSANIDIVTEKADNILFVPIQAVYKEGDKSYVDLLLSDETQPENIAESVNKVEVNTGINDYYYIEITSGLKEGDIIITSRI